MRDEEWNEAVVIPGFAVPRGFVVVKDVDDAEQARPAEGMPAGWTHIAVRRKKGNTFDKYWFSPMKSYKFNAEVKVRQFLAVLDQVGGDEVVAHRLYLKKGRNGGSGNPKTLAKSTNTHKASSSDGTLDILGSNECGERSIDVTNVVNDKRSPAERPRLPTKKPQKEVVMMVPRGFVVEQSPAVPTKKQPPELSMTTSAILSREWRAKKKKSMEEEVVESTKRRSGGGGESSSSIVGRCRQGLVVTPPPPSTYKGRDEVVDPRQATIAMVSTLELPKRKAFVNACNGIRTSSFLRNIDADGNENIERNIIISPPSNNANAAAAAGNTGGMKLVRVICGGISIKPPSIQQISGWSDEIDQREKPPSSQSGPFSDKFNWSPITLVRSPMKTIKKMKMTLPSVLEDEPLSFDEGAELIPSNICPYSDETGNKMSHGGVLTMRVLLPAVDESTCQEGGRTTHSTPAKSISKTMFSPITAPLLRESPRGITRTIHDDDNACTPNPIKYQNYSSSSGYTPNNTFFGSNESSPSVDMVDLLDCLGGMIA